MTYAQAKAAALSGATIARDAWTCFDITAVNGRLVTEEDQLFYPTPQDIRATDWTAVQPASANPGETQI